MARKAAGRPFPKIILVGPTNVGKSTLFNRLTRTRAAIVCDRPGVTVDRHELQVTDSPIGPVEIVDTGGVGPALREHPLGAEIERAASEAARDADLVLFVVDGTRDIGPEEQEAARWLRRQKNLENESVWLVANKCDTKAFDPGTYHRLGFARMLPVSAEHALGIEELWDEIGAHLAEREALAEPEVSGEASEEDEFEAGEGDERPASASDSLQNDTRVIVLGRPNVGKSTLLNAILGYDRHVVSEMAGTTRDVIASEYHRHGKTWKLLDTAGQRRPGRLEREVEWVAKHKMEDAARGAHVALIMIDATEGVTDLDAAIAGQALEFGLSLVLVVNKWDLMQGEDARDRLLKLERTKDIKMDFLQWCPVVEISALTGKGVPEVLKAVDRVLENRGIRVSTGQLNRLFESRLKHHTHPMGPRGRPAKFYYLSQVSVNPPQFVFFSNLPAHAVHFSYRRYITNCLREEFGFEGTPIRLFFKTSRTGPAPT